MAQAVTERSLVREAYAFHELVLRLAEQGKTRDAAEALMRQEVILRRLRGGRTMEAA